MDTETVVSPSLLKGVDPDKPVPLGLHLGMGNCLECLWIPQITGHSKVCRWWSGYVTDSCLTDLQEWWNSQLCLQDWRSAPSSVHSRQMFSAHTVVACVFFSIQDFFTPRPSLQVVEIQSGSKIRHDLYLLWQATKLLGGNLLFEMSFPWGAQLWSQT